MWRRHIGDFPLVIGRRKLLGHIEVVPAGIGVPPGLEVLLRSEVRPGGADCLSRTYVCLLLEADLSSEVQPEFVLFVFHTQYPGIEYAPRAETGLAYNVVFRRDDGKWQKSGHLFVSSGVRYGEIAPVLKSGDYAFPPAVRRDLRIGDKKWIWVEQE
ncbi:MAG: hypothetical protein H0W33_02910 [Gammaproteobacteria bacterium]|nr:hypothetical protein [Gammaproteobacteria bacterium]